MTVASEEDIGGHEDIRGHFTLGFKGAKLQSMSALSHDATTTDFETALSQLNTVGSTRVTRAVVRDGKSEVGYTWNVTFTSLSTPSNIGADLPLFEVDSAMLSGTGLILKVERLVRGCCSFALSWNGGADFSTILSPALPFRFDRIPVVTSVYPKHGPASGGTILTVLGAGFWDSKVACLFGEFTKSSVLVDANRINSGEILCVVPRQTRPLLRDADNKLYQAGKSSSDQEPSSIRVRVVIGNIFASNSTSTSRSYFHYDRRAVITAIVPKSGPMTGGTAVRIYGRNFIQSDESRDSGSRSLDPNGGVLCRFGDGAVHVRGVFLSSGELECHSPRISTQGDFSGNPSSESNHETVFVPLEISLNGGADFTDSGIQFWYRPAPSVTVITPRRGPSRGGTKVLVQGKNFERSPLLRCKFGNSVESSSDSDSRETDAMLRGPSIVQATWISPSSLFCVSPVIESRPEVQVVTVRSNRIVRAEQLVRTLSLGPGHNITGGNFTLSFGDRHLSFESVLQRNPSWETTDPIPWNATADMVKDALMKLTSVVSVRVESVYSANHNTGSSSDHRPGPFGTFAWRVVFDKTPWRVPLLHTSNSGIGLLANGGGFAEVIPISEGTSFGVNLEENSITLSGPVKIDSIQEFSLQADNVVYATQVIRCFAAVSISATVLADSKFALKMDGTQVSILDEITYISCSGPDSSVSTMQQAVEEALSESNTLGSAVTSIRVSRSHAFTSRGWDWTITFVGASTVPGLRIHTDTGKAGVTTAIGPVNPGTIRLGGNFSISLPATAGGNIPPSKTKPLPFDSSAAVVEAALNAALSEHASLPLSVSTLGPFRPPLQKVGWRITFPCDTYGYVAPISADIDGNGPSGAMLLGTSRIFSTIVIQEGTSNRASGFTLGLSSTARVGEGNTINVTMKTPELGHSASALEVEHAIEKLFAQGAAGVVHTSTDVLVSRFPVPAPAQGYIWRVTFPETITSDDSKTPVLVSTLVQRGDNGGDEHSVTTSVDQRGTFETLRGQFTLKFQSVASWASPEKTPLDVVDDLGNTHEGKISDVDTFLMDYNASAGQMADMLRKLPYVQHVEVTRTTSTTVKQNGQALLAAVPPPSAWGDDQAFVGYTWSVTFISYGDYNHQGFAPLLKATPVGAGKPSIEGARQMFGNSLHVGVEVLVEGNGPSVALEVTNNGQQFSDSYVEFDYHPTLVLGKIYPVSGPAIGGTRVVIHLAEHSFQHSTAFQFDPQDSDLMEEGGHVQGGLSCRFNNSVVPAGVESFTSISCFTPPHVSGNVSVSVSLNGEDFSTESALSFHFSKHLRQMEITPLTGPTYGGTVIVIRGFELSGAMLASAGQIKCAFGNEIVPAFSVSPHKIRCRTPPVSAPRAVNLEITTNNEIDFTQQKVQFRYEEVRHVSSVHPRAGPATGNTVITVSGGPFPNYTQSLFCRFGSQIVSARFLDESAVECTAPKLRPVREVQRIIVAPMNVSDASGLIPDVLNPLHTFRLEVDENCVLIASGHRCKSQLTAPLPWNATTSQMKTTLESLPSMGIVRVTRFEDHTFGPRKIAWFITFVSDRQTGDVPEMRGPCWLCRWAEEQCLGHSR